MKMTVPAIPVSMESARMASTSTNVCAVLDIQVCLAKYRVLVNMIEVFMVSEGIVNKY